MAVKEGGPNPDANYRLKALMNAKAANMPKDNVERAIKKATSKDQADFKQIVYEVRPSGCCTHCYKADNLHALWGWPTSALISTNPRAV